MIITFKIFYFLFLISPFVTSKSHWSKKKPSSNKKFTTPKEEIIVNRFTWSIPINYSNKESLNKTAIQTVLSMIERNTCIRFYRENIYLRGTNGFNYKYDYARSKCYSPNVPDENPKARNDIFLSDRCKNNVGVILKFTAKMLGLFDTFNRHDRDMYLKIELHDIDKKNWDVFKVIDSHKGQTYRTSFDYGSALMVGPREYSRRDVDTVKAKPSYYQDMLGQEYELSFTDYQMLNYLYCFRNCYNVPNLCTNGGYQHPDDCSICICPHGYAGWKCEKPIWNKSHCGVATLKAISRETELMAKGDVTCSYIIKASKKNYKIKLHIKQMRTKLMQPCYERMGIELRIRKDKSVTGLCLCGNKSGLRVTSEGSEVLVVYNGHRNDHIVQIGFKQVKN